MSQLRILVCGGRYYANQERLFRTLDRALDEAEAAGKTFVLIHGGAKGADALADRWARNRKLSPEIYVADWQTHGRAAGPIRNIKMLTESKPHAIIAFEGGKGTAHMTQAGRKANVKVLEIIG
jgi:hypothetical protein